MRGRKKIDIDIIQPDINNRVRWNKYIGRCRSKSRSNNISGNTMYHQIIIHKTDTLASVIAKIKNILKQKRAKIGVLSILTHGAGIGIQINKGRTITLYVGIEFGKNIIVKKHNSYFNILTKWGVYSGKSIVECSIFKKLRGHFASKYSVGIEFLGCEAASREPFRYSGKTYKAFGYAMCRAIARYAETSVMASEAIQVTTPIIHSRIERDYSAPLGRKSVDYMYCENPGPWEGKVYIFYPNGHYKVVQRATPKSH